MKTKNLLLKLAKQFPKRYAKLNHDFVGLMTGKLPLEVNKIVLCLDLDEEIIDQVIDIKPDLVITHHPFIYGTKAKVFKYDENKKNMCDLLDEHNIPVYSMHTNFDTGLDGMNDALAKQLNLNNIRIPQDNIMMRIGDLNEEMDVISFAKYATNKLDVDYSLLIDKGNKTIKTVAIIGGGGSNGWKTAKENGADIYISGDAPHHVRRSIVNNNYNYLDMPHEIEKIFMPQMYKILKTIDESIEIISINHEKLPLVISK